jgi:hypothetical protein
MFETRGSALALFYADYFGISSGKSENNPIALAKAGVMPEIAFEKHTLPNGLQPILHVDRRLSMSKSTTGITSAPKTSA